MFAVAEPVPYPQRGRVFTSERVVRLGDVTPRSRLRLDALVRYLQDIATDDALDGKYDDPHGWVVRRTEVWMYDFPAYLDTLQLATWCGGLGSHWAERRTRVSLITDGASRVVADAATLWVHVDLTTLKPLPLPPGFSEVVAEAAGSRTVGARLHVGRDVPSSDRADESWAMPLRFADFDAVRHVNNAVYWEATEEYLSRDTSLRAPLHVTVEHHRALERGAQPVIAVHRLADRVVLRHLDGDTTAALTQIVRLPTAR
jgi:acyl-ACP thioesterase